jgi:transcriptional regulator with XRE-family HTH domain
MSIVSNNIKYLRRLNGLTQEQFARKIAIKRSLLGAYEEARANPNLTNLKNMATAFGVSVDNLLKNDLRRLRETPEMSLPLTTPRQMTVSHSGTMPQPTPTRTPGYTEPQPLSKIMETYQQPEQPLRQVSRQISLKPVSGETHQPAQQFNAPSHQPVKYNQPAPQQEVFKQPGRSSLSRGLAYLLSITSIKPRNSMRRLNSRRSIILPFNGWRGTSRQSTSPISRTRLT